ncbi:acyl-CoA dehydrogenase family protein [Actinoplanes sp. GCM10030250]|uniref:acyl-CoA dehydrogenase family protein n=1 Tax=Actinoplanes sp. GCM10030250 TaxID=3273376 RepID=UPI0036193C51
MDFRLDDAQQAIMSLAAEVLAGADTPERIWKDLGQAGLLSLAVPVRLGGSGLGVLETALVLTEVGRRAAAVPALSALALGVLPVARWGSQRQQDELLTDGRVLSAAIAEPGDPLPASPRTTTAPDGTITGVKTGVTEAQRILVTAGAGLRTRQKSGVYDRSTAVMIVDTSAPGVSLDNGVLRLDNVPAEPLGDHRCHADLHRYAIAGACALADGALAGALSMTAEHVRTRHQFGRPLATFQAVAQQIADVYIASRTLHLAAVSAAWRLGTDRDADDDLAVAAQWLTAEALPAVRTCHHLHGGLGLVADYPLHRHTALLRDLVRFLGGSEHCLEALGDRVAGGKNEERRASRPD